jgi:large subunit ribosomal protein L29
MDAKELREKTSDQLNEELETLKKEGFNLRFQQATGQVENTARMRQARSEVARVKTIINEKSAKVAVE